SNLMYWDAAGSGLDDVAFVPVAEGQVSFSIWTQNFTESALVDGAPGMVAGKKLGTTNGDHLALHAHRWFFMEGEPSVPEGVYLAALQLRAERYVASDPFYIVAATSGVSASLLDNVALPWVESRVDSLVLAGDYNFDGVVDGDDYLVWHSQY